MSSLGAQVSVPLLECKGSLYRSPSAGEVKGDRGGMEEWTGEGCLSSRGSTSRGISEGPGVLEQNSSYKGHGSRMLRGQATYDSSEG